MMTPWTQALKLLPMSEKWLAISMYVTEMRRKICFMNAETGLLNYRKEKNKLPLETSVFQD